MEKPAGYYEGINVHLLNQVPATAGRILEIGCGAGALGACVKERMPGVVYHGLELDPEAASSAAARLDRVFVGSIESDLLSQVEAGYDCIVFGDVLEHLYDPLTALRRVRPLLQPGGIVLCSVPNAQHHSVLASLLSGDFQYQDAGLLDRTHVRFFTYASFIKLMLDAGLVPEIVDATIWDPAPEFSAALKATLIPLRQDPVRGTFYFSAYQYIFRGRLNPGYDVSEPLAFPISFIVPTNDRRVLGDNFLSSAIFRQPHPHQLILLENQPSAGAALANGVRQALHDFVVYAHQDVYLPDRWDLQFTRRVFQARQSLPEARVFGVYGVNLRDGEGVHHGLVMDRHWARESGGPLPVAVESLDEMLIGFWKAGFPGVNPELGYHFYGTDLVCAYREQGGCAAVVEALCFHNSGLGFAVDQAFHHSAQRLIHSPWRKFLPLATSCVVLTAEGAVLLDREREDRSSDTTMRDTTMDAMADAAGRFQETVVKLDASEDLQGLLDWLQSHPHDPGEMLTTAVELLTRRRIRTAYILAMILANQGYHNPVIGLALGAGGVMFGNPMEEQRGLECLRAPQENLPLNDAQRELFQGQIVASVIHELLGMALPEAGAERVGRILALARAVEAGVRKERPSGGEAGGASNDTGAILLDYFENYEHRMIHKWMHYFEIYERHFSRFRGKPVSLLEFGVYHGGSLQMWKHYFGPQARIYGVDVDPRCVELGEENIQILIADQEDRESLRAIKSALPRFDIIIDDGGHTMTQQIVTIEEMYAHLNNGGIYLIEDLHTSYMPAYGGGYRNPESFIEYAKHWIDALHAWHSQSEALTVDARTRSVFGLHYYDSVLVIEKRVIDKPDHFMSGAPSFPLNPDEQVIYDQNRSR
ncbi:MAG: methyltransferase domain-containing protein [Magnetococcales bacterium]|nr:methyltransferase domain-containing protein [Magnetococcales bacterium]